MQWEYRTRHSKTRLINVRTRVWYFVCMSSQYLMYKALRKDTYVLPAVSVTILTFSFPYLMYAFLRLCFTPGQSDGSHGDEEAPAVRPGQQPSLAGPAQQPLPWAALRPPRPPALPAGHAGPDPRHGRDAVSAATGRCRFAPRPSGFPPPLPLPPDPDVSYQGCGREKFRKKCCQLQEEGEGLF